MADNDSKTKPANDDVSKAKREEELEKKLSTSETQKATKDNMLTQLLAKSGVQEVLKAEQEGRRVVMVDQKELDELRDVKASPAPSTPDVSSIDDNMSNKELAATILATTSDLVERGVKSSLSSVRSDVDKVKVFQDNAEKREVEDQIKKCQSDHPDEFDSLQKPMYGTWDRLMKKGPSVEDIFILTRAYNSDPVDEKVETEKPDSVATTTAKAETGDEAKVLPGAVGFKQMLAEHQAKAED